MKTTLVVLLNPVPSCETYQTTADQDYFRFQKSSPKEKTKAIISPHFKDKANCSALLFFGGSGLFTFHFFISLHLHSKMSSDSDLCVFIHGPCLCSVWAPGICLSDWFCTTSMTIILSVDKTLWERRKATVTKVQLVLQQSVGWLTSLCSTCMIWHFDYKPLWWFEHLTCPVCTQWPCKRSLLTVGSSTSIKVEWSNVCPF